MKKIKNQKQSVIERTVNREQLTCNPSVIQLKVFNPFLFLKEYDDFPHVNSKTTFFHFEGFSIRFCIYPPSLDNSSI